MSLFHKNTLLGASGAGGAAEALYVDDVFSTFLYEGNNSTQTITNGIDLSGEGGLVWFKSRDNTYNHGLFDTERGATKFLRSNTNNFEVTNTATLTGFNSDGFDLGADGTFAIVNYSGSYASWTFRKAPGFFDVVTYTGDGVSGQTISHNLGSVPGFIIIKNLDETNSWNCWHRGVTSPNSSWWQNYLTLNTTNAAASWTTGLTAEPTSTSFTVGTGGGVNKSNINYVAYLFAHDDQSFGTNGDESIIKCGGFSTGTGVYDVDLGWEPQWVLIKNPDVSQSWRIFDNMRGFTIGLDGGISSRELLPNTDAAESNMQCALSSTGFRLDGANWGTNRSYIYVAIRRPHKPPTAGTDVFNAVADAGSSSARTITAGNLVDFQISKSRNNTYVWYWLDRLRGAVYVTSSGNSAESSSQVGSTTFDVMDGMSVAAADGFTNASPYGGPYIRYFLTRAPGFFDVVAYTGTGSNRTVDHNLGAVPELMIVKCRSAGQNWAVYASGLGNTKGIQLQSSNQSFTATYWNNTTPGSTSFSIGTNAEVNSSSSTYIAYLFATLAGISKVGTYSGNTGNNVDVDCGFSAGARFVLIKRTNDTGDWYIWDSQRGIATGNDPYIRLNLNNTEVTSTDYIDPLNSGFTVTSSAPAALNASGGTYLFLAIA